MWMLDGEVEKAPGTSAASIAICSNSIGPHVLPASTSLLPGTLAKLVEQQEGHHLGSHLGMHGGSHEASSEQYTSPLAQVYIRSEITNLIMHASWGITATESATFAAAEEAKERARERSSAAESARVIQNLENKFETIYLAGRLSDNGKRRHSE